MKLFQALFTSLFCFNFCFNVAYCGKYTNHKSMTHHDPHPTPTPSYEKPYEKPFKNCSSSLFKNCLKQTPTPSAKPSPFPTPTTKPPSVYTYIKTTCQTKTFLLPDYGVTIQPHMPKATALPQNKPDVVIDLPDSDGRNNSLVIDFNSGTTNRNSYIALISSMVFAMGFII